MVQITKLMMLSAAEEELGALYVSAKQAAPLHQTLGELSHPEPPKSIQTDNSMAYGVVTNKAMKAMDMCFHWLHNCKQQQQFDITGGW